MPNPREPPEAASGGQECRIPSRHPFTIRAERRDGVARISAFGELDLRTVPLLERALEAVDRLEPARVVLDFRDLSFVDSTGVHAILRAHIRATENGSVLVVANSSESVRKVFELTRTEHVFEAAILNDPSVTPFEDAPGWLPIAIPEVDDG
ncbi:MAG: STAS domain-containing protein [Actinomycetota bacterium]